MAQDDIQGQVVDAQGNPVDGAIVELTKSYQSSPTGQEAVQRTTTDSNGNYIFEGHPDADGTTQEWHVSAYNHDGTAYVNSFNNPGVTADFPTPIPDSVVQQHYATTWTQGDGTWVDDTGNANMSLTGDPQAATLSDGSDALSFDTTDDYGESAPHTAIEGNSLKSFALEFAFEFDSTDTETLVRRSEGIDNQAIQISLNVDEGFNDDAGNMFLRLEDQSGDGIRFGFQTNPGLNDGTRKDLSVIFDDATTNDLRVILNGTERALSFDRQQNPTNFGSWGGNIGWFAEVDNAQRYFSGACGAVRWHDQSITNQTISDY